jgi:[acyl-carrier-protein] S-malonyltransferase
MCIFGPKFPAEKGTPMSLAFVFSGGMAIEPNGIELYEKYPVMRNWYQQVEELTGVTQDELLTENFLEILRAEGAAAPKRCRRVAAVRRVALCLGVVDVLAELGVRPDAVGGYSLGCMVAACVAGSVSRAELLALLLHSTSQPLNPDGEPDRGVALAVLPADADLEWICGEQRPNVFLAADLGLLNDGKSRLVMLSGYLTELEQVTAEVTEKKLGFMKPTGALGGNHNPRQQFMYDLVKPFVDEMNFADPAIPFASSLERTMLKTAADVHDEFLSNIIKPVHQHRMSDSLVEHGVEFGLALGADTPNTSIKYPFPSVQVITPADIDLAMGALYDYGMVP